MDKLHANYEEFPKHATRLADKGLSFNEEMNKAYNAVEEMKTFWKGTNYNLLAKHFNDMTPTVNEMAKILLNEVPEAISTAAQNYARADSTSISAFKGEGVKAMRTLDQNTPRQTLDYDPQRVLNTMRNVETNFARAIENINDIQTEFLSIDWESEAQIEVSNRIAEVKQKFIEEIEQIKRYFSQFVKNSDSGYTTAEVNIKHV